MVLMFVKQVVATLALRGPLRNWGTEGGPIHARG